MTSLNCSVMCKPPSDDLTVIFAVLLGFIPGYCYKALKVSWNEEIVSAK